MKKKIILLFLLTIILFAFLKPKNKENVLYIDTNNQYEEFNFEKENSVKVEEVKNEKSNNKVENNEKSNNDALNSDESYNDITNSEIVNRVTTYIDIINKIRRSYGLSEIYTNPSLDYSSSIRAKEISSYFSHNRLDGSSYHTAIKYSTMCSAENIASGFSSIRDAIDGWMNSPSHRANILNNQYLYISISSYVSNGMTYWDMLLTC